MVGSVTIYFPAKLGKGMRGMTIHSSHSFAGFPECSVFARGNEKTIARNCNRWFPWELPSSWEHRYCSHSSLLSYLNSKDHMPAHSMSVAVGKWGHSVERYPSSEWHRHDDGHQTNCDTHRSQWR